MRTPKARAGRKLPGAIGWRAADAAGMAAADAAVGGRAADAGSRPPLADPDADQALLMEELAPLYQEHYRSLVRLAALLVSDLAVAEEIVQEAFAEAHGRWRALPGHEAALRYLRQSLVRRSRTVTPFPPVPGTRAAGLPASGREAILLTALRALPARQREVLVLRYFADLPEAEIAAVTGTRIAAIRSYAARGMSSLRTGLPGNVA